MRRQKASIKDLIAWGLQLDGTSRVKHDTYGLGTMYRICGGWTPKVEKDLLRFKNVAITKWAYKYAPEQSGVAVFLADKCIKQLEQWRVITYAR